MTTRASTARGQDKQQFQGRVRKWRRQWDIAGDTAKYKLLRWVSTERTEDRTGPRIPGLLPVIKPVSQCQSLVPVSQKALSTDQQAGSVTTIRDASLGDGHTEIYQDPRPSSQVAGNSFTISVTNTLLPEQSQTPQLNGTVLQQKLPALELNRQSITVSEGIAPVMQGGKSHGRMESLPGHQDETSPR
ncbi:hypothetical protein WJX79_005288 [Trebouxia sp. C0005]